MFSPKALLPQINSLHCVMLTVYTKCRPGLEQITATQSAPWDPCKRQSSHTVPGPARAFSRDPQQEFGNAGLEVKKQVDDA